MGLWYIINDNDNNRDNFDHEVIWKQNTIKEVLLSLDHPYLLSFLKVLVFFY